MQEDHMQELRDISDKIVSNTRKLHDDKPGKDKFDNYFLSTDNQVQRRARDAILAEHPLKVIEHPDPDSLPPALKRDPETVREMAANLISNEEYDRDRRLEFKKIKREKNDNE